MGVIELIAKFDPVLCQHLQRYSGTGRGVASYLSKTVCEELIVLMGKKVEQIIIQQIKEAKYYSIMCGFHTRSVPRRPVDIHHSLCAAERQAC